MHAEAIELELRKAAASRSPRSQLWREGAV